MQNYAYGIEKFWAAKKIIKEKIHRNFSIEKMKYFFDMLSKNIFKLFEKKDKKFMWKKIIVQTF